MRWWPCAAETIVLALSGYQSAHLCGRLDIATIEDIGRLAEELGFFSHSLRSLANLVEASARDAYGGGVVIPPFEPSKNERGAWSTRSWDHAPKERLRAELRNNLGDSPPLRACAPAASRQVELSATHSPDASSIFVVAAKESPRRPGKLAHHDHDRLGTGLDGAILDEVFDDPFDVVEQLAPSLYGGA